MEFLNFVEKNNFQISKKSWLKFVKILFPFAPHLSQEIWSLFGNKKLLDYEKFPEFDLRYIEDETKKIIIQINGKKKDEIEISDKDLDVEKIKKLVLEREKIKKNLVNKKIKKIIFAQNKIINLVTD
jgi:leucyl-tRNA synthetase